MDQHQNIESGEIADIDSFQEPSDTLENQKHVFKPNARVFRKVKHRLESTQSQDGNSPQESEIKKEGDTAQPNLDQKQNQVNEHNVTSTVLGQSSTNSNMILVRVKRPRGADDLDQIYIDYDNEGKFKKTKLVTEKDSMLSALSMFQIGSFQEPKNNNTPVQFALGQKTNVVKLQKISLDKYAKLDKLSDHNRLQQICQDKLNQTRQKYKQDKIAQRRRQKIKESLKENGLDFQQKDLKKDSDESKDEDTELQLINNESQFEVVDLDKLLDDDGKSNKDQKDGEYKEEFFLMQKSGERYFDPLDYAQYCQHMGDDANQLQNTSNEIDEDQDSQDSNREDASQNDYPDEDEEGLNWQGSSDDNDYNNKDPYDSDEQPEPTNHKLKNSIFDQIRMKNKNWAQQNHAEQFDTGCLDDYEPKGPRRMRARDKFKLAQNASENCDEDMI